MSVTTPANQTLVVGRKRPNLKLYMAASLAIMFAPCLLGMLTLLRHH